MLLASLLVFILSDVRVFRQLKCLLSRELVLGCFEWLISNHLIFISSMNAPTRAFKRLYRNIGFIK